MDFQQAVEQANRLEDETGRPHRIRALGYADENDVVQYRVEEIVLSEHPPKQEKPDDRGYDLSELEGVI